MPDSRFNENNPNPLYLVEGNRLTPETVSGSRYSFQHISMKDVAVLEFPNGFRPDSEGDLTKFFPNEYNMAIAFNKIGDCNSFPMVDFDGNSAVQADPNEISSKPSGFITPVGTLIPQIIVPWYTSKNRMVFKNPTYPIAKSNDLERVTDWYGWFENGNSGTSEFYFSSEVWATDKNPYDSFLNANGFTQRENSYTRVYTADVPRMPAFAFLLDIVQVHPNASTENPAYVQLDLYGNDADTIRARFYQNGNVTVTVWKNGSGNPSSINGTLSFTEMSQKTPQCRSGALSKKNVVFFYTLLNRLIVTGDLTTNNEQSSKALSLVKDPNLDLMSICSPSIDEFPTKHKDGDANGVRVNSSNARFTLGDKMKVTWVNCLGSFGLSKVRFCPRVRFSFFYRMDGTTTGNNDGMGHPADYFCLETGGGRGGYNNLSELVPSKKISYDKTRQSTVYRADFDFYLDTENNCMSKYPFEILGLIHVTRRRGRITDIKNDDGNFGNKFDNNINGLFSTYRKGSNLDNKGRSWIDYVTNVSVTHGLDGTSGSMTLDKYLMMDDLVDRPVQSIGAVTLCGKNIVKYGERSSTNNPYPSLPDGQFFRGYAIETADSQSSGGSDLTVSLTGIQTKLAQMALVNTPYWDGDRVFGKNSSDIDSVLNYFISYSGCDLRYVNEFSLGTTAGNDDIDRRKEIVLPRSFDYQSPAVHFNMGTSCLDGLKEIARMINHQFVIQPDGRGYFYGMDVMGCPVWVKKGPVRWTYDESEILSLRLAPYLENKYNAFLTLSLLGTNTSKQGGVIPEGTAPGMMFSEIDDDDSYPWCRVVTNRENGILTRSQLEKLHLVNVGFGRSQIFTGSITVPGRNEFYIFDKIRIIHGNSEEVFYIYGITHSVNMQTKEWTTELQIADFNVKLKQVNIIDH